MLKSYGYNVSCAADCESAFNLLGTNKYHIILLDINLPDSDGFELCKELRRTSTVPVILQVHAQAKLTVLQGLTLAVMIIFQSHIQ